MALKNVEKITCIKIKRRGTQLIVLEVLVYRGAISEPTP